MRVFAAKLCSLAPALAAAAALAAAGCVSSDLSRDAETTGEVAECLPTDTPAPTSVARAIWYPHASGFESSEGHETGVLALAGGKLWFMEWNDAGQHLDMEHVIDVLHASAIKVVHFGTSSMLVVQSGNESFDSFELMNGGEIGSDPRATEALCDRLQALQATGAQLGAKAP
jgi:hypothetical protein